jgi:hypothetical protein
MKRLNLGRYALSNCVVAVFLVGCGGSQPPIGEPGAMSESRAIVTHAKHGGSWMLPEAKGEDLLYVTNLNAGTVTVYDYQSHDLVGTLDIVPTLGECVDRSENIYVTGSPGVVEYAHGGTAPIRKITDAYGNPYACSVDKSGHVAVANFSGPEAYPGNITVYGNETIKMYSNHAISYYSACGYDPDGNLLVGGWPNSGSGHGVAFAILPKGGSKLINVWLGSSSQSWPYVGAIQWDGKYWAVSVPGKYNEDVYRFSIANGKAKAEGRTTLYVAQEGQGLAWIVNLSGDIHTQGTQIITGDGEANEVQYFKYPAGKKATASIADGGYPAGLAVSLAPK